MMRMASSDGMGKTDSHLVRRAEGIILRGLLTLL